MLRQILTAVMLTASPLAAQQAMSHDMAMAHSTAFMKAEGAVTGGYTLGKANDHDVLMLSDDFTLGKAPTPFVVLSTTKGLDENPVWLGAVKSKGAQTFEIPAGTMLSQYRYVVIWCKSQKVTLASAELPHGAMSGM